jgi:hypothetical protein|tara:strand:+ start:2256 stop:2528 length:273 start_codon:yes stop_codon:yes gene_type:complete
MLNQELADLLKHAAMFESQLSQYRLKRDELETHKFKALENCYDALVDRGIKQMPFGFEHNGEFFQVSYSTTFECLELKKIESIGETTKND